MNTAVAAVIVTYNRAGKLPKTLDHVLGQSASPQWVVVVDNASTDGTAAIIADYAGRDDRVVVVSLDENTGGAGGFATGMARGYELGADFVWIMDDDCYPDQHALEELVNGHAKAESTLGAQIPYACSLVKFIDGSICEMNNPGTTWDWGRLISKGQQTVMVTHCSFVSVLFPRWVLTKYGLPLREYFIWFDDQEYTLRITKDCPGVQVLTSVAVHDMGVNRGVNFGDVTPANIWKFEYGARNEASFRLHRENPVAFVKFVLRLFQGLRGGRVAWPLRMRLFKKVVKGVKFNPQPEYPRSVL